MRRKIRRSAVFQKGRSAGFHFFGFMEIKYPENEHWIKQNKIKKMPFLDEWMGFPVK
jgi:hypothetical protein